MKTERATLQKQQETLCLETKQITSTLQQFASEKNGLMEEVETLKTEKEAMSTKMAKYHQNLKAAMQKLKQFKTTNAQNAEALSSLQAEHDALKSEVDKRDTMEFKTKML